MAMLFGTAVSFDRNERGARRAFWAVSSFDGKLAMLNEVIKEFDKDHLVVGDSRGEIPGKWAALYKQLRKRKRVRNKLAHGVVRGMEWSRGGSKEKKSDVFFLPYGNSYDDTNAPIIKSESDLSQHLRDPRPPNRMRKADIVQARHHFHEIEKDLEEFHQLIVAAMRRLEDPSE